MMLTDNFDQRMLMSMIHKVGWIVQRRIIDLKIQRSERCFHLFSWTSFDNVFLGYNVQFMLVKHD